MIRSSACGRSARAGTIAALHGGRCRSMSEIENLPQLSQPNAIQVLPLIVRGAIRPEDAVGRTAGSFFVSVLAANGVEVEDGDVLVVSSKVATIFEGGQVHLDDVVPSRKARMIGRAFRRDPRKVELVLEQGDVFLVVPMKQIIRQPSLP